MGKIPLGSTSCFGACEAGSMGVCKGHFGFRGTQRPPAPTPCCSQHQRLHHAQQSSQTSSARPSGTDIISAHQRPPRTVERAELSYLASHQEHHPGMWQTLVQVPKGYVYSMHYKHTSPGSGVLCRNALSHFVEINTKLMLSQIWVCLAHIRPTISTASALLQGPGGVRDSSLCKGFGGCR